MSPNFPNIILFIFKFNGIILFWYFYNYNFKFIISTPSIIYGTNLSITIIDIDDSFIVDSSRTRLYQLIGRAGRKGRSNSAVIIFRNMDILFMLLRNDNINIEARQIEEHYQRLL